MDTGFTSRVFVLLAERVRSKCVGPVWPCGNSPECSWAAGLLGLLCLTGAGRGGDRLLVGGLGLVGA